jgi:hypothetical protein
VSNGKSGTASQALEAYYRVDLDETKRTVFTGKGNLFGFLFENNSTTDVVYVQLFNKLTADVTVGTTVPDYTIKVGAGSSLGKDGQDFALWHFDIGLVVACTSSRSNNTAPASDLTAHMWFWQAPQSS